MKRRKFITASVLSLWAASRAHAAPARKSARPKPAQKKPVAPASKPAVPEESPRTRNLARLPSESPSQWRDYELHATLAIRNATDGLARLWLPLAQYRDTPWMRSFGHHWQGNFETAGVYRDPLVDMEVFRASWPAGVTEPRLEIVSRFATQDRRFDITRRNAPAERGEVLRRCLLPTGAIPLDGIVRRTAEQAIGRIKDPLAQAKALYDWVVENTVYDPRASTGDSARLDSLLENGRLAGRSVEISRLFVGLCRAIGIPARPVFGLRIDESRLFPSLGASGELRDFRHCRAEFHSPGYGWVPVDPSDVRKAILAENLGPSDPRRTSLQKLLFGFWEMDWIAFNAGEDVPLHGSAGDTPSILEFFDAPIIETDDGRFGDPAPDRFGYSVTARRV